MIRQVGARFSKLTVVPAIPFFLMFVRSIEERGLNPMTTCCSGHQNDKNKKLGET